MAADTASAQAEEILDQVVIRFAGDSGDGIQVTGAQFAQTAAVMGNDLATLPDFPAEIRAPVGTTFGVSSFQIRFGSDPVATPGDAPDVLVAFNPAALRTNLDALPRGGTLIVNSGAFGKRNLERAGYQSNPLTDDSLNGYQRFDLDISGLALKAVEHVGLSHSDAQRCKNFWALGLVYWMYGRDTASSRAWILRRFRDEPQLAQANLAALDAGFAYGETAELGSSLPCKRVRPAHLPSGRYRMVTGTEGLAFGLLTGVAKAELDLFFASYPITPASGLLHTLAKQGLYTFQAEDEIAAACAAIGASFAGSLGVTATSGPGMALKTEALGLAVAAELPLVVINCQRAGPSTGLPTKTEQSDLLQAVLGRNGDTPLAVLAASGAADCFETAVEAVRIATTFMTPVILLADGYLMHTAQPWAIPDVNAIAGFPVGFRTDPEGFQPFLRDAGTLARVWAVPGTPGLEHRLGGLERGYDSGNISYDPANHQKMTDVRAMKISGIARHIPPQRPTLGETTGDLAVVGWGSTFGAIEEAVQRVRDAGRAVSHIHLRHLNPFPENLGELLKGFRRILVPELNAGQLLQLLRSEYLLPARGLNQVSGLPFKVADLEHAILSELENN